MTTIIDRTPPTAEEYNELRAAVGWPIYPPAAGTLGLSNSLCTVSVRQNNQLIAFGRVIGDGVITFYIQDVIVLPGHRGQGHAKTIMDHLMRYIAGVAAPGSVVGLMSAKGVEGLCEKYGFVRRPSGEIMGAGMVLPPDHNLSVWV